MGENWGSQKQYFDKNGVEIHDGDVLEYQDEHMKSPALHLVFTLDGELHARIIQDEYGKVKNQPPDLTAGEFNWRVYV